LITLGSEGGVSYIILKKMHC